MRIAELLTQDSRRERAAAWGHVPFRVLEVGGGSGLLSHSLRTALSEDAAEAAFHISIASTDSGVSQLHEGQPW